MGPSRIWPCIEMRKCAYHRAPPRSLSSSELPPPELCSCLSDSASILLPIEITYPQNLGSIGLSWPYSDVKERVEIWVDYRTKREWGTRPDVTVWLWTSWFWLIFAGERESEHRRNHGRVTGLVSEYSTTDPGGVDSGAVSVMGMLQLQPFLDHASR